MSELKEGLICRFTDPKNGEEYDCIVEKIHSETRVIIKYAPEGFLDRIRMVDVADLSVPQ